MSNSAASRVTIFWSLIVGIVSYVVIQRLVNSRAGRAMAALKDNEPLAMSVGIDVTRYLVLAAVISAAMAGAAGSLYAHYVKIIDPNIFLFIYTVTMVIMVITGGKGTLAGPIVGGVIFGFLPVVLRSFAAPEVQWIDLRRADDHHRLPVAAGHRAGHRTLCLAMEAGEAHARCARRGLEGARMMTRQRRDCPCRSST